MGYGTFGFIGGAAKAGQKYGEALMEDEFEKRREERLQRMKEEMEASRRKWDAEEHDRRKKFDFQIKYGEEAETGKGSVHYENENEVAQFERMTPLQAGRTRETTAAQGEGSEARDRRLHDQNLERDRLRDERAAALQAARLAAQGSGASDSGPKPAGATELNHARSTLIARLGGSLDGDIISLPKGMDQKFEEAYAIVVDLMEPPDERPPLSLGRAVSIAMASVGVHLTEGDAQDMARQEARNESFGLMGGNKREAWIEKRTRELMEQSRRDSQQMRDRMFQSDEPPAGGLVGGGAQGAPVDPHATLIRQAQEVVDAGGDAAGIRRRLIEMGVPASSIPF